MPGNTGPLPRAKWNKEAPVIVTKTKRIMALGAALAITACVAAGGVLLWRSLQPSALGETYIQEEDVLRLVEEEAPLSAYSQYLHQEFYGSGITQTTYVLPMNYQGGFAWVMANALELDQTPRYVALVPSIEPGEDEEILRMYYREGESS